MKKDIKGKNNIDNKIMNIICNSDDSNLLEGGIYSFVNPFSYYLLRSKNTLNSFDKIYIDGILLVNILNFFRFQIKRKSFDTTSLATTIFENVSNTQKSIYFIGSEEVHINKFIKTISSNFPKMKISGYRNGFFNSEEEKIETIKNIINLKPDVIVVGMGTPYQENFMLKLKANSFKGAAYSCGGFIHQTTEKINYYPKVFDKLNLRWLYRMIDEPKLIKRYFMYYPISILYFTVNLIKYKYSNK